uniref:Uncharacterized protein n=1 Tax=Nelumbo nucifera TaxID=4432 RepID=A0A822YCT9_NELNU|nr:TPA_asm: hypothetical protein HUJ06_010795 [Nelumbo nucifera]
MIITIATFQEKIEGLRLANGKFDWKTKILTCQMNVLVKVVVVLHSHLFQKDDQVNELPVLHFH